MKRTTGLLAALLPSLPFHQALSWGTNGHSIIAEIAQHRLEPGPSQRVKELLGGDVSLASLASWADDIVQLRPNTLNWHFVNIPFAETGYDPQRDCSQSSIGDCVINAIQRARTALADASRPKPERREALMFLVHFVGDVHQPLHCADRNDAGGTRLMVIFFGVQSSLHLVWDVGLVERRTFDWGQYVTTLETDWLPGKDLTELQKGDPVDWALEAHKAAVDVAYALSDDLNLGDVYYQRSLPIVDRQLALAGIRLARLLNEALSE
jgi:hypothetical protein